MSEHEEEFRLAPLDDDEELGLKPLDAEEEKIIAPDFPLDTQLRLMPVICSACRTRLYATEDQVGMWKVCPDCLRKTEIRYVEPEFHVDVELDENGGYIVKDPEIDERPNARIGVDYRTVDGYEKPDVIPQRSFNDEQPKLESMLQSMLNSKEEKERIKKAKEFEAKIEEQMRLARQKKNQSVGGHSRAEDWKTDEFSATAPTPTKPTPKRPSEKISQPVSRPVSEGDSKEPQSPQKRSIPRPPPPPSPSSGAKKVVPVPPRKTDDIRKAEAEKITKSVANATQNKIPKQESNVLDDESEESTPFWPGLDKFLDPFLSPVNRKKLVALFVIGFFSNFFLEHVKSAVGRAIFQMRPDDPGRVMSWAEMGLFSINFFIGTFFGIIWLILVLMFGISILTTTATGRIKVERWIAFDLKIGLSYFFWTALITFLSFYPGVFLIWTINAFFPAFDGLEYVYPRLMIFFGGPFFVFPILFLCIIETDTFYKGWPKKTLGSLIVFPSLWIKFYLSALIFSALPILFLGTLAYLNTVHYKNPWMQSHLYYFVAAFFETLLLGFFPLIYCRFLGRVSWVISQDYPEYEYEEENEEKE